MKAIRSMVLVSSDKNSLDRGAGGIISRFQTELQASGLSEEVTLSTICDVGNRDDVPLVIVYPEAVVYGPVRSEDVPVLVEEHLKKGRVVKYMLALMREMPGQINWLGARQGMLPAQKRIVLERVGLVDPESLEDFIMYDGYQALGKALTQMSPAEVIAEVEKSGLQGRGGAGFPTGRKWGFVNSAPGKPKYVICNADESEPGTFKDRMILEGDPFSILEAMTIAGYAVGAAEGYIYIRGEYRHAYRLLENAIGQAETRGLLGEHIFGTDFNFHIHLHAGAGAYICGEETALIEFDRRQARPASGPPALSSHLWSVGQAHLSEQRGDPGKCTGDPAQWRRLVPSLWLAKERWYQGLHHLGERQLHWADRSSPGHHLARGYRYLRERHEKRSQTQAGADRRLERLNRPSQPARHPDGLRILPKGRRFPGLWRSAGL